MARAVFDPATSLSESIKRSLMRHTLLGEPPPKVGRYTIVRRLGSGAMGVVYAGRDEELDRTVAIKLLHRRTHDAAQIRFAREAQGLARLSHPNVVQIYEIGEHEGASFMAMEYVDGETLASWRQKAARPWREVLPVLVEAGRGLAAAHRKGLIHRDFKPENVMVDGEGRVRVMDFGLVAVDAPNRGTGELELDAEGVLARRQAIEELEATNRELAVTSASPLDNALTKTGSVLGTPAYMSPEQYSGLGTDARSDQFSYCVAAWELLYGQRPFSATKITQLFEDIAAGRHDPPPADVEVPSWIHAVIVRGLAPEPRERWPNMDALLDALGRDPTVRRRWWTVGAVTVVTVAALLGARELRAEAEREAITAACAVEADAIQADWNPAREAELAAGFTATGLPFADESWTRTQATLATYASEWAELRGSSCREAGLEQVRSEAEQAQVRDCLDEARLAFAATLDVLATADASLVAHAGALPSELPELAACVDPRRLADRVAPPTVVAEQVPDLRAKLARIKALQRSARFPQASELAQALVDEAAPLAWPAFEGEALLTLGEQQHNLAQFEDAAASYRLALRRAAEARDDALALRCVTKLARVLGYDLARSPEGLTWAEVGETLVARQGAEASVAEALLLTARGTVAAEAGDHEQPSRDYARALSILEDQLGPNHPHVAVVLHNQAAEGFALGRLDEAAAAAERSLGIREQAFGPHHPLVADSLATLGTIRDEQGDYASARELHRRALDIREVAYGPDHPRVATSLSALGLLDLYAAEFDRARPLFERALGILRQSHGPDHPRVAEVLDYLAAIDARSGKVESVLALAKETLRIREVAVGTEHPLYAHSLGNVAELHSMLGELELARAELEQVLAIDIAVLGPEHRDVGATYRRLGSVAAELGQLDEALERTEKGHAVLEAALGPGHPDLAPGLYLLGSIRLERGEAEAAVDAIGRAIDIETKTRQGAPVNGESAFLYARALWAAGERERGREWGEAARKAYAGDEDTEGVAEVDAWLGAPD